jgi:nitronate monooxygenase
VRTTLCELMGIEHPIVQAPIGSAATPGLAAAVSEAGALGTLALTWSADPASQVREARELTSRPFGVNLVLEWDQHERLDALLEAGARIVSLTWGNPDEYVEQIHDAGGLVLHTIGSAEEARRAVEAGVDVVVAQGWEAGGHVWGDVATLPLVAAVVDAVDVPVIAAGGIGDGRGIAAALALGASGAWLGTRFLLAEEAPIHVEYRRRLVGADERDTVWLPDLFDRGWEHAPHRALRNSTVVGWEAAGRPGFGARPGEGEIVAHSADGSEVVRYSSALPLTSYTGDVEALSLWAGQSVGLIHDVAPAAEIVEQLVAECDAAIRRLAALA